MASKAQMRAARDAIGNWGHINKFRLRAILEHAGEVVLDVGCSTGEYVQWLNKHTDKIVYGIDILDHSQWFDLPEHFANGSITELPFASNSFDTLTIFEVLEHIPDVQQAIAELYRVTRKRIIVSVPNCEYPPEFREAGLSFYHEVDPTHCQRFTSVSLPEVLNGGGFQTVQVTLINPIRPELLLLTSWHFPSFIIRMAGRIVNRFPIRQKYYMTLLAVADK
jgi:SAM-dependent methyltransferase